MIPPAILNHIRISRPLIKDDLMPIGEGFNFMAYAIEDMEILLVSKDEEAAEKVPMVCQVLKELSSRVTLEIPQVLSYEQKNLQHDGYYLVKRVMGEPLTPDIFESCASEEQRNYILQLVEFIHEVHQFPLTLAKEIGLQNESNYPLYSNLIEKIKYFLFPALSAEEKEHIQRIAYEAYDNRPPEEFLSLVHGDMSPEHIFFSPESKRLTGIIDFADLQINDPDYDLMYLYQDYGLDFIWQFYPHYSQSEPTKLHTKIQFFNLLDQLDYIAEGILDQDKEQEEIGFDSLRSQLENELDSDYN